MKINMYGGALTISYNLAKFLRRKGLDVTLFIDEKLHDKSYAPVWEDEELSGGYPSWIQVTRCRFPKALQGDASARRFVKILTDCDVLHLHGEAYLWANLFDKDFIFQSYGYDLDQVPFRRDSLKAAALAFFARRGIRRARRIIIAPHQAVLLQRLGIEAERGGFLPFPVDLDKYARVDAGALRGDILRSRNARFVFFHPSRHEWKDNPTTNNKGNDKVLRAFAAYRKARPGRAVLVLVNKGRDTGESKRLIGEFGMQDDVLWLDAVPKKELIEYYNASDIVLDQFTLGSFGLIFLESMACGRPTCLYLKGYEGAYAEQPPVINALTAEGIAENLVALTGDPGRLTTLGERSREWMRRYHQWPVACDAFIKLYDSLGRKN